MHIICGRNESEMIWGRRGDAAEVYRRHELNGEKGGGDNGRGRRGRRGRRGGSPFFPLHISNSARTISFFAPPSSEKATGLGNEPKMQEQKRMPRCSRNLLTTAI